MTKELLMAVDLGTSFIKVGVYDLDGQEKAVAKEPVKSEEPGYGRFIQHGEDIVTAVLRCIKKVTETLAEDAKRIAVIGFTGQMAGFIGVDKNWNDVTGWSCSLDTEYMPYAEKQMEKYADQFYNISGTNSPLFSSKYEWFQSMYPNEAKRIAKYLVISGYVIGCLGDISVDDAVIDGSLITWTGLADVRKRSWSSELCSELGMSEEFLPRIVESSQVVARLSKTVAEETGLIAGIPLVSGAGDKIAGCVGAENLSEGDMLFEAASFGAISCMVKEYRPDQKERRFDILNGHEKDIFYAHYYMPGSGMTQKWYMDNFWKKETETLKQAYDRMDQQIAKIAPGSEGIFACGMLGGTVMPLNGNLSGAFIGQTWSHGPAHLYRALVESFAYALSLSIRRMNAMYPEYSNRKKIRMIGGGAASSVSAQIYADVLGVSIETLEAEDPALWGACMLGAQGVGLIDNLAENVKKYIKVARQFVPNEENTKRYAALVEQYKEYTDRLTPMCAQLKKQRI